MILDLTLDRDEKTGKILNKQADYNPSDAVKQRTTEVIKDFGWANEIRNRPYREFNDTSLVTRMSIDQMSYNQFVQTSTVDPAESWRSEAYRGIVRDKVITIAAHITAAVIYPQIFAQNDNDQEDKDGASVMRDIMEWSNEQAKYDQTFITSVIAALVNPCGYIYTEYAERFREIKEIQEDGSWEMKEVLDELFSGFQDMVIPTDEIWISNIYQSDIQKQPYLIWRRVIDYDTAKAKYGDKANFKFVQPGIQFLYSDEQNTFYEQYDEDLTNRLVEEVIYWNRMADLQLTFVNGILLDDVDQPNKRIDKRYPIVKFGYELIDEGKFFYYKSLPFKLAPDEEVVNTLYRMIIDGTYLDIMKPAVAFGQTDIGSPVIAPGVVTTIDNVENPNAAFQTIDINSDLAAGGNMLDRIEKNISEASADVLQGGTSPSGTNTAFEISRVEQNARIMLGLFGKMVAFAVRDFGELRVSDIIQHMTIGEVMDIEDSNGAMKFRNFILPEKTVNGKTKTKRIEFDMELPDEGTEEQFTEIEEGIAEEQRDLNDDVQIYRVNPEKFRSLKFSIVVQPERIPPRSDALNKALQLEEYVLAIANPLTNKEAVTRDLLLGSFEKTKDDPDKYMLTEAQMAAVPPAGGTPPVGGMGGAVAREETGSSNLKTAKAVAQT